jgi:hypothetical protein
MNSMKLTDILKNVLSEDTWQTNPSSAGSMSPGKTPNALQPATNTPNVKFYDVAKDFQSFEKTIEIEEEAAKRTLETTLKTTLGNKKVVVRASKGSVGQTEQDYTINAIGASVTYMSDKFYVIVKGDDGKDYYINPAFKVKVLGPAEKKKLSITPQMPPTGAVQRGAVGGVVQPQNMGLSSNQPTGAH